jgi:four helix bundle protein
MVYGVTKKFPQSERYSLTDQFQSAAISIPANIAEGYARLSKAEKLRFLNIAQGSLEECRYYIILSFDLGYIIEDEYSMLYLKIEETSKLLNSYCKGIREKDFSSDL